MDLARTIALAILMLTAGTAAQAGNYSYSEQRGKGNASAVAQKGSNLSVVGQAGSNNRALTDQSGRHNVSGTAQIGRNNAAVTGQQGYANVSGTIQVGSKGHQSGTYQAGGGNFSLTIQSD